MRRWHWVLLAIAIVWGLHELTKMRQASAINAVMLLGR